MYSIFFVSSLCCYVVVEFELGIGIDHSGDFPNESEWILAV